ncbi:LAMI_0F03796g1_1 [Lachancea mirantina]|uniref:LAMI_0F03796g1_1 n=1 Tax=Lachancea mirantina TaxID=1230905 RepID=A0A1G4JXI5_9SACH|nr:LAMI_0F03796g1_1 [Lachancea mirantina]
MRVAPPPRKSRVRRLRRLASGAHRIATLKRVRRYWNLHKVHKINRRNKRKRGISRERFAGNTPLNSGDFLDLGSFADSANADHKPLIITSYPNGCGRSPRVKILQRNSFHKSLISKRRYKLRKFNPGIFESTDAEISRIDCFESAVRIKRSVSKHADVKVTFEERNVIKTTCLPYSITDGQGPEYLQFGPGRRILLADFSSLTIRANPSHYVNGIDGSKGTEHKSESSAIKLRKRLKRKVRSAVALVGEFLPVLSFFQYPDLLMMSVITDVPQTQAAAFEDDEISQTITQKMGDLFEVSKHASNAFTSYTRMMRKLSTISPHATRTVRTVTVKRLMNT